MDRLNGMLAALDSYTDAQLEGVARNMDDGGDIPGVGLDGDHVVLLDRVAFIAFLRRED